MLKLNLYLTFLCISLSLSNFCLASAPATNPIKLKPLKISWNKNAAPIALGLNRSKATYPNKKTSIIINRTVYSQESLTLNFIPKSNKYAPLIVDVPNTTTEVKITLKDLKPVTPNTLWLWGNTPPSQCGGSSSLSARFLNKKSIYTSFGGLFTWKLRKDDLPETPVLYVAPSLRRDLPQSIKSSALETNTDKVNVFKCRRHHGATCPFIFTLKPNSFGLRHRIKFKPPLKKPGAIPCPV